MVEVAHPLKNVPLKNVTVPGAGVDFVLETAFGAGVTHFGVARSYGYSEAEKVLGLSPTDFSSDVAVPTR